MAELMNKIYTLLLAGVFTCFAVQSSSAQNQEGQWDLMIPSVSALLPLSNVVDANAFGTGTPSGGHEFSAMFGGRLTYWFIPEMGAELELLFAPSALETDPFGLPGTVDAQFFSLNARLVYAFGSDSHKPYFLLTGGLGLWATNYEDYDMTTGGMGVVALGLRIPMDNALSIRIDLSNYMTTTDWELASGGETDKILQHDLALTVGLSITLNKK